MEQRLAKESWMQQPIQVLQFKKREETHKVA